MIDEAWRGEPVPVKAFLLSKKQAHPTPSRAAVGAQPAQDADGREEVSISDRSRKRKVAPRLEEEEEPNFVPEGDSSDGAHEPAIVPLQHAVNSSPPRKRAKPSAADSDEFMDASLQPSVGASTKQRKPRNPWSDQESELLLQAFELRGRGNWKEILDWCSARDKRFQKRSSSDMRDKIRVMERQARRL